MDLTKANSQLKKLLESTIRIISKTVDAYQPTRTINN